MPKYKAVWTKEHDKLYTRLYNKAVKEFDDLDKDTYILQQKRNLLGFIQKQPLGDSSKKSLYFMVSRWLQINKPDDRSIKTYQEYGYQLMKKIEHDEQENTQTEKETLYYRPLSYFNEILENTKDKESQGYLFLALLTLQPALRSNFYNSAMIIESIRDNDKKNNFVYINRSTNKVKFIVNDDKVKNTMQYGNGKHTIIDVESRELSDLIIDSFDSDYRLYLFDNDDAEPINYSTLLRKLRKITKLPGITVNMFRSAHVNELYNKSGTTQNQKKALALKMRHSLSAAQAFYFKIIGEVEDCDEAKAELAAIKKDREINETGRVDEIKFNKKRYDVIYRLNKIGNKPKQSSIDKYNLKFKNGIWY